MKKMYKILIAILILVLIGEYYYFVERKAIEIDRYNFQQLEKAKKVVENLKQEQKYYRASSLSDFNYQFDTDIEPLDKRYCYDVYYSYFKEKNDYTFMFGFKLHSLLYMLKYGGRYYNYPGGIISEPEPSEQCKKDKKNNRSRWMPPSCAGGTYYAKYMNAVNNPCKK